MEYNRVKEELGEIIRDERNNPILVDTTVFSPVNPTITDMIYKKAFVNMNSRDLKVVRKYYSYILAMTEDESKIVSVPAVIPEISRLKEIIGSQVSELNKIYEGPMRDAIIVKRRKNSVYHPRMQDTGSELAQIFSRIDRTLDIFKVRANNYQWIGTQEYFKNRARGGAKHGHALGHIKKIDEADVELVAASLYEVFFKGTSPYILSCDRDIDIILRYTLAGNSFSKEQKDLANCRIKTYRANAKGL